MPYEARTRACERARTRQPGCDRSPGEPQPREGGLACLLGLPDLSELAPFSLSPSLHDISLGAAHRFGDRRDQEDLARMAEELSGLVVSGAIRPLPIRVLPRREIPDGLDELSGGHVRGKLVAEWK